MTTTPTTPMPPAGPPQFDPNNPKAAAKAAKAYAKATRPWYKKKRFLLPIALVVIIAISQGASGGGDGSTAPDTTEQASVNKAAGSKPNATEKVKAKVKAKAQVKAQPKVTAIPVRAAQIVQEFEDNELAADAKYKGKTLRITGVVDKIDTELLDDEKYILQLGGGGDYEIFTVNCHDMSTGELSTLKKGNKTTVIGVFDDGGDLGVDVKDCKLS